MTAEQWTQYSEGDACPNCSTTLERHAVLLGGVIIPGPWHCVCGWHEEDDEPMDDATRYALGAM